MSEGHWMASIGDVYLFSPESEQRMTVTFPDEREVREHFATCRENTRVPVFRRAVKNLGPGTLHVESTIPGHELSEDLAPSDVVELALYEESPGGRIFRI